MSNPPPEYQSPKALADQSKGSFATQTANLLQVAARLAALTLIFVAFGLMVPGGAFFKIGNVENILMQSAVYSMAGLGMTIVIITGGIDLAAGSTIALSMVMVALTLKAGDGAYLAAHPFLWTSLSVVLGTLSAMLVGVINGLLITGLRLVPFIVTLGAMGAIRGSGKDFADNQEISPHANWLYHNLMFPVQGIKFNPQLFPIGVWATIAIAVMAGAMLKYTKLGRRIYAVGSSESTARLCGVPVAWTKIQVYALAGMFSGLAGVLEFSKLNMGQPTGAMSYESYVIAACVIGGASLMGGVGTISGTIIGALMIGTLNAGAQQVGWKKSNQEIVIGLVIIAAAALDSLRNRKSR